MSGHNGGPGPQPRHTVHPAIMAVAAAIIVLALGACTSTSTAASAGSSGDTGTLTGSGSTYVAPFFALAFAKYHQEHPAVTVNYSAVGSSGGIAALSARQVGFGDSDVPMNASEQAAARGGPVTQVPVALGAESVVYNLSLPAGARLRLTGQALVSMLDWLTHDGQAYAAANSYVPLPAQVRQLVRTTLQEVTGPTGTHLLSGPGLR